MKADSTTYVCHIRTLLRRFWPLWVLGLVIIIEVAAQLLYPQGRTLPLARYNHEFYGFKTTDELSALEQKKFSASQLQLASGTYQAKTLLSAAGAELDEEKSARMLTAYGWRWRAVPFSIFFIRPEVSHLPVSFHAAPLGEFATKTAQAASRPAKDATLSLKEGRVEATNGEEGYAVSDQAVKKALSAYSYDINGVNRIDIPGAAVQPTKRASDLQDVYAKVQVAAEKRLTITVKDRSYTPTSAEITSWLELTGDSGATDVRINSQTLGSYLDTIDKDVRVPAGTVTVRYVDGREQSREGGEAGEQIDRTNITTQLTDKLFAQPPYAYVSVRMATVAPTEKREYSYSSSQEGLQAKVDEIGRRYNVRLSLHQLDGSGWRAGYRGDESTPSASTYKLFVAIKLFDEMAQGRVGWDDPMLDTTVAGCFDRMILVSTNPCAEEWLRQFGRTGVNEYAYSHGISRVTDLNSSDAARTSADDLARVVEGIYTGTITQGANQQKLLDMMSRQIWRKGIPSGTAGWTSDKVGFLWDYVHDVGVVHHPRGTYVMAVMTKGANYGVIAQITREIEEVLYP